MGSYDGVRIFLRGNFPQFWRFLRALKSTVIRKLLKRLDRKGKLIYLGAVDQDKWVIEDIFKGKRGGYFLELGAHDGFGGSNTYVLEKRYGWNGICIEANPTTYKTLTKERDCVCVCSCIDGSVQGVDYIVDGAIGGILSPDTDNNPEDRADNIAEAERDGRVLSMETKTLDQVLRENNAPKVIDFFSFDVEGAETRILKPFPFDEYVFLTMIVERASEDLNKLLSENGYHFVTLRVGDSFYVHESISNFDEIPKQPFKQVPPKPAPLELNYKKKRRLF